MEKYDDVPHVNIWNITNDTKSFNVDDSIDDIVEQKLQSKNFSLNMEQRIQQLQSELDFLKEYVQFLESHKGLGTFEEGDPFK